MLAVFVLILRRAEIVRALTNFADPVAFCSASSTMQTGSGGISRKRN
jgi:hypothetical protein